MELFSKKTLSRSPYLEYNGGIFNWRLWQLVVKIIRLILFADI